MGRNKKTSPELKLAIVAAIPRHYSFESVAVELGIHPARVYRVARSLGLVPKQRTEMRNQYTVRGTITEIVVESPKYGTKITVIDTADLDLVRRSTTSFWHLAYDKRIRKFYIASQTSGPHETRRIVLLHRIIAGATDPKQQVDHIGHDGLDNRRCNLRLADYSINQLNRRGPTSRSTTGILGVDFNKDTQKYRANIRLKGKSLCLGYFTSKEAARNALVAFRQERGIQCQLQ